jgi:hypothetical protein
MSDSEFKEKLLTDLGRLEKVLEGDLYSHINDDGRIARLCGIDRPKERLEVYNACEKLGILFKKFTTREDIIICKTHNKMVNWGNDPCCGDLMCHGVCPKMEYRGRYDHVHDDWWDTNECNFEEVHGKLKKIIIFSDPKCGDLSTNDIRKIFNLT